MKKLTFSFGQVYLEPGAAYSFSPKLLTELERRISRKLYPSEKLLRKHPNVEQLLFHINASVKLKKGVVRFGEFYPRQAEAQYSVVLPYSALDRNRKRRTASGLKHLVDAIENFLKGFQMSVPEAWCKAELLEQFLQQFESYVYDYD